MQDRSRIVLAAAQRGIAWLVARQNPDGTYGGEDDLNAYYKSPYPLRAGGEPASAARCMDHVARRYLTSDGDFMNAPDQRTAGTYTRLWCQVYPNFWLLRAAHAMSRHALAGRIYRFMLTCQDSATGGSYFEVDRRSGLLDSNSTACLVLGGLMGGDVATARRAGDALLGWRSIQDDPSRFYLRWAPGGEARTEFADAESLYWVVDANRPAQAYWQVGLPQAALAKLYEVTEQPAYLEGSIALYDFLSSCQPDAVAAPTVGKLGWGSALLHRITGDERYLRTNRQITDYYLQTQHADGYWLSPAHASIETQPLKLTIDLTAEFSSWLLDYLNELG
ncbi:MAG: hypothetical protein MUC54_03160 [Chloroflexi bacterium]|nr:hypothetical protein [Chloroflexota bacterium]